MRLSRISEFRNIKGDIYGGITSAVVALPLALAFGVASGIGPIAGLYGAIFLGFFAALFGGTPSQISGPTGPMTIIMAGIVAKYSDNLLVPFTIVMMAGFFQITFGLLKFGKYISLIPFPVISGFMTGIGCIIIIMQIAPFTGHVQAGGGVVDAILAIPEYITHAQADSVIAGSIALGIILFTPANLGRIIPSPLIALFAGSFAVMYGLHDATVLGEMPEGLPEIKIPYFNIEMLSDMVSSALILALLGSIDSLLTSLVADNMTRGNHHPDQELIGQGIGNTIAGLFGGIPGAGATMRTVVNIRTGGATAISGMLHSLILLAVVMGLGHTASNIPHAVLAGILMKVGIDIIDWGYLNRINRAPRAGVIFMLTVLLLTIFVNLIVAVSVGVVLASLLLAKRMADLEIANIKEINHDSDGIPLKSDERRVLRRNKGKVVLFTMSGPMSFGAAREMAHRIGSSGHYKSLVIDISEVPIIDSTTALALDDVIQKVQDSDKHIFLVGINPEVEKVLDSLGVLDKMASGHCINNRLEALKHAAHIAGSTHPQDVP